MAPRAETESRFFGPDRMVETDGLVGPFPRRVLNTNCSSKVVVGLAGQGAFFYAVDVIDFGTVACRDKVAANIFCMQPSK